MACPAEDVLDGFATGRLDEATYHGVERHLDTCDECLRVVTALSLTASPDADPERPEAAPDEPRLPAIGRYRVLDILGEGGMGRVYLAHDPQLDRRVAVKVLRTEHLASPSARARMVAEARAMARIVHPNIVTVFDAGEVLGTAYIAMELVVGTTLARWLEAAPRSAQEVLGAFASAGSALVAAHEAGVVHRDFKPANVLVDATGRIAVTDFGLASSGEPSTSPDALAATLLDVGAPSRRRALSWGRRRSCRPSSSRGRGSMLEAISSASRSPSSARFTGSRRSSPRASRHARRRRVGSHLHSTTPPGSEPLLAFRWRSAARSVDPGERFPDLRTLLAALDQASRRRGRARSGSRSAPCSGSSPSRPGRVPCSARRRASPPRRSRPPRRPCSPSSIYRCPRAGAPRRSRRTARGWSRSMTG